MEYIKVDQLSFAYDKEAVVDKVSFSINSGEFVTLTGENGASKTTLIKLILGILKAKEGKVILSDKNYKNEDLKIAYLPQQVSSFNSGFPTTVYEFVKSGLYRKNAWFKKFDKKAKADIQNYLEAVLMWDKKDSKIGELSGGQKQRVIIARMLVADADIYVLDEPTNGMDELTRNKFYDILSQKVTKDKATILMVTHDNEVVDKYATKNIHLCKSENNSWCCHLYTKKGNQYA